MKHNDIVVSAAIPAFNRRGNLPQGIHWAGWEEIEQRFGASVRRRALLVGLRAALDALHSAGCLIIYLDGSFVTSKSQPGDYDACWGITDVDTDQLDPVFLDFSNGRSAQKLKYMGEFFPAELPEGASGRTFLEFFQVDRNGPRKELLRWILACGWPIEKRGESMITNERQLKITRAQATRFEKTLADLERRKDLPSSVSPLLRQAERDALASQLSTLQTEIEEYEALRGGGQRIFDADSLGELPGILIKARIVRGLTQRDLAERLGLKEQQIQRYEGTGYASASLQRVQQVIDALEIRISERISMGSSNPVNP